VQKGGARQFIRSIHLIIPFSHLPILFGGEDV